MKFRVDKSHPNDIINVEREVQKMKTYIVEETVSVTYFHKVWAENMEQAKEKFFDDFDVEYSFRDQYYGDDTSYEFFDEEEWEG